MTALLVLNAIAAGLSVAVAVFALIRPATQSREKAGESTEGEVLYSRLYAVRAIPLGLAVGIAPFFDTGIGTLAVLGVAAFAQGADAWALFTRREQGRSIAPAVAAGLHLALGIVLLVQLVTGS